MGKTVPPAPDAHDDAATAQTLVDILQRQRERDRRLLRLANSVAITAFILAITPDASEGARPVAPVPSLSLRGEPATPTPEHSPARTSRPAREADTASAMPQAPAFSDVDVQVGSRTDAGGELRDYVVTLKDAAGVAFTGADVRLQGRMADRRLVEVVLDPSSRPGQYRAEVRVSPDGPGDLRLRITVRGTTVVVPITPSSGS